MLISSIGKKSTKNFSKDAFAPQIDQLLEHKKKMEVGYTNILWYKVDHVCLPAM